MMANAQDSGFRVRKVLRVLVRGKFATRRWQARSSKLGMWTESWFYMESKG